MTSVKPSRRYNRHARLGSPLVSGVDMPGYASLMVAVIFMGGVQLVVLGIIGEYLGRMYSEAKQRPLYIVESVLGIDPPDLRAVVVPERAGERV